MSARPPMSREVAEKATDWLLRAEEGLSPSERADFAAWREADPQHEEALDRLEMLWTELDETVVPPLPVARVRHGVPVLGWSAALAACLALFLLGGGMAWIGRLGADHVTAVGEMRRVTLSDGSVVQLDGDSAIAVDFTPGRRTVRLLEGRALFRVRADRERPFVVQAGESSSTALGTQFVVERDGDAGETVVTEHQVAVRSGTLAPQLVAEGQGVRWDHAGLTPLRTVDTVACTAWTRGRLVVMDQPLGDVLRAFGRYRSGYVRALGGDVAAIRVSGVYDITRPDDALESLRRSLHLKAFRLTDRLILLHR